MKVTFTTIRNTRFIAEKGRYNCEAKINGVYLCDASGDTVKDAKEFCMIKVKRIARERGLSVEL